MKHMIVGSRTKILTYLVRSLVSAIGQYNYLSMFILRQYVNRRFEIYHISILIRYCKILTFQ